MRASSSSFFSFFIVLSVFLQSYVYSQTPNSCSSFVSVQSQLPFDATTLRCVNVWASEGFILGYAQAAPNVWNFLLSVPNTNSYVGMGFSSDGQMVGSSAIVGWIRADGTSSGMKKYFLGGKSPNLVTVQSSDQGLLQVGKNSTIILESNQIYMAFQLIGDSPSTHLIYAVGPQGVLPFAADPRLAQHRDMYSAAFNYNSGAVEGQKLPESSLKRNHGILNMLGWSIMLTIGAMVARYMKRFDPIWFYSHVAIQSFGFLLGLIGIICGLVLENRLQISVTKHKAIGIFILVLGWLQVIALFIRPSKESKARKYWNWYHHNVGRLIIILAAINVFYGIHLGMGGSSWNTSFAAVLIILITIILIFEIRRCLKD